MTGADLVTNTLTRLGDDPASAQTYYNRGEVLVAINHVYRLMCFLTLCLETTVTFNLGANTPFSKMLTYYSDWILPLRVRITGGSKLISCRLADIAALDGAWSITTGTPERYALLGFDLLCVYKVPAAVTNLDIVYARSPIPLTDDSGSSPQLQTEYHQTLIHGAIPLLRAKEGAQEFSKVLGLWERYMAATKKLGDYVRARNRERGYDRIPAELARFDQSKILNT